MAIIRHSDDEGRPGDYVTTDSPFPVAVITHLGGARSVVLGAGQYGLSVTSSTAVALIVPNAANAAEMYVRTAAVVFLRDGTVPTATKGLQANAGDFIILISRDELLNFKVIAVSASATLDVEYFTKAND